MTVEAGWSSSLGHMWPPGRSFPTTASDHHWATAKPGALCRGVCVCWGGQWHGTRAERSRFVSVLRCFYPVFFHIQMLWELVLLGEALVVMAPSPAESSDTVLALVRWTARAHSRSLCHIPRDLGLDPWPVTSVCSCISPLRCCSDFRPYFTIHDSEFKEYTTRTQAPSVIPPFACCF